MLNFMMLIKHNACWTMFFAFEKALSGSILNHCLEKKPEKEETIQHALLNTSYNA